MNNELGTLIAHLNNLHNAGTKQATFDVEFLLRALGQSVPNKPTKPKPKADSLNVDGGGFND